MEIAENLIAMQSGVKGSPRAVIDCYGAYREVQNCKDEIKELKSQLATARDRIRALENQGGRNVTPPGGNGGKKSRKSPGAAGQPSGGDYYKQREGICKFYNTEKGCSLPNGARCDRLHVCNKKLGNKACGAEHPVMQHI